MKTNDFSHELEHRTLQFAIAILKLTLHLSAKPFLEMPCDRLVKSGVGVGANFWEAYHNADDEKYELLICQSISHVNNTIYWLKNLEDLQITDAMKILSLVHEAIELRVVFIAMLECKKPA